MSEMFVANGSKPPRIVLVISSLGGGGAEKVMASLANSYSARDDENGCL